MTRHDAILKCLGTELTELRKARGWDRDQAADELRARLGVDMHPRALASYEHPSRVPPLPALLDLAELYEVSPGTLLESAAQMAGVPYRCGCCGRLS
jgi:transcriptional regulator with XRE-family HTH domain